MKTLAQFDEIYSLLREILVITLFCTVGIIDLINIFKFKGLCFFKERKREDENNKT